MGLILRMNRTDQSVLLFVIQRRRRRLDRAVCAFTHLGGATITVLITLLLIAGPQPWHAVGLRAAFALAASHGLVQVLKRGVCRSRPHLPVGMKTLVEAPDRFSFPSGHAAAALSITLPLSVVVTPWLASSIIALGLLVGVSRCYLGVHYPGDVVAGWVLAAVTCTIGIGLGL